MTLANPQGKGSLPVLQHLQSVAPAVCTAKSPQQVLDDYFVGALILSADFHFKPSVNGTYYLYYDQSRWSLSLVGPQEWGRSNKLRAYVGRCTLRPDMTWQCETTSDVAGKAEPSLALAAFLDSFRQHLESHDTLEDGLPFYVAQLPFYRRLLATGLAASLRTSRQLQAALPGEQALAAAYPRIAIQPGTFNGATL